MHLQIVHSKWGDLFPKWSEPLVQRREKIVWWKSKSRPKFVTQYVECVKIRIVIFMSTANSLMRIIEAKLLIGGCTQRSFGYTKSVVTHYPCCKGRFMVWRKTEAWDMSAGMKWPLISTIQLLEIHIPIPYRGPIPNNFLEKKEELNREGSWK